MAQRALYSRIPALVRGANGQIPLRVAHALAAGQAIGDTLSLAAPLDLATTWQENPPPAGTTTTTTDTGKGNPHLELLRGRRVGRQAAQQQLVDDERENTTRKTAPHAAVTDSVLLQMMLLGARPVAVETVQAAPPPDFSKLTVSQALQVLEPPPLASPSHLSSPPGGVPSVAPTSGTPPLQKSGSNKREMKNVSKRRPAPPSLHPATLATHHSSVFDSLFQHTVLELPRLVADAVGAFVAGGGAGEEAETRKMLGAAVGGPILDAIQNMLCDTEVVTLVREAVVGSVRSMLQREQQVEQ